MRRFNRFQGAEEEIFIASCCHSSSQWREDDDDNDQLHRRKLSHTHIYYLSDPITAAAPSPAIIIPSFMIIFLFIYERVRARMSCSTCKQINKIGIASSLANNGCDGIIAIMARTKAVDGGIFIRMARRSSFRIIFTVTMHCERDGPNANGMPAKYLP
jgi:hypothetical protein